MTEYYFFEDENGNEVIDYEATKARKFINNLKKNNSSLDLTRLCNDFLEDKVSPEFFNLVIAWTWNGQVQINYNTLPKYAHWAIWSASEPFTWYDINESEINDISKGSYNDVELYKSLVKLAMNNPILAWEKMGISSDFIID